MNTLILCGLRTAPQFQRIQVFHTQTLLLSTSSSLLRHASTSTTSSAFIPRQPKPPNASVNVNGPPTTLPPPLNLPIHEPNQFLPQYYFKLGKAYLTFYKTGIKNVFINIKAAHTIQSRLNSQKHAFLTDAVEAHALTRSEFQLIMRNRHDMKRIPLFALVALICGEFTPLVVVALGGVVPWTCRIPKQIHSDRSKLETRRAISFRNLTLPPPTTPGVKDLQRMQLLHISWSLGLSSKMWDWLGGTLPGLPTWILRNKVDMRVQYLNLDDMLIKRAGGVAEMEEEEIKMACVDRGIDVSGKNDAVLKRLLEAWLKSREKVPVESLLLTRPPVWPVRPPTPSTPKPIKL